MRAAGPRGAAGTRVVKGDLVVVVAGALGRTKVGIMGVLGVISKLRLGWRCGGGCSMGSQSMESAGSSSCCGGRTDVEFVSIDVKEGILGGDTRWSLGARLEIENGFRSGVLDGGTRYEPGEWVEALLKKSSVGYWKSPSSTNGPVLSLNDTLGA